MHTQVESYMNPNELIDERCFEIGQIYYIKDSLIDMPNTDRLINGGRKIHEGRMVVIAHNNDENHNKMFPVITVAPLSHRIDLKRPFDLPVNINDVDGELKYDSLIMMYLIQPVCKVDLERCVGVLKEPKTEEMLAIQIEMLGIE